jgi:hypothetical protein
MCACWSPSRRRLIWIIANSTLAVIGGHHEMNCRLGCMVRMVRSLGHPQLVGCCPASLKVVRCEGLGQ